MENTAMKWTPDTVDLQAVQDAIARLVNRPGGAAEVAILRRGGFTDEQIASMSPAERPHQVEELRAQGVNEDGLRPRPGTPLPPKGGAKPWGMITWAVVGLIVIVALVAYHNAQKRQETAAKQLEASEQAEINLLLDPSRGPAEIDRRLRERMSIRSRVLTLVEDPDALDVYSLPVESHWVVSCVSGVSISFGAGAYDGPTVNLSTAIPRPEECKTIVPLVGERVRVFLAAAQ